MVGGCWSKSPEQNFEWRVMTRKEERERGECERDRKWLSYVFFVGLLVDAAVIAFVFYCL